MRIEAIDVDSAIANVKRLLNEEPDLSPALKSAMEVLLLLISLLLGRAALNSKNSSKPPSSDPNRHKTAKEKSNRTSGGQKGHIGTTLKKIPDPDEIEVCLVDRKSLPKGNYTEVGFETRQVFDIDISRLVIEYRAQILEDESGNRFTAEFPEGVTKAVQYGNNLKAHAVYLSQYQLLPYKRVQEYFAAQLGVPVSEGSLYNFNMQAFERLADFEQLCKDRLAQARIAHADETGINIGGIGHWLHCASNKEFTHFFAHEKRGSAAMDEAGILPRFKGILCHDHWKPYFTYSVAHALCNAHHIRELTYAFEQDKQAWAKDMIDLLKEINCAVNDAGGSLGQDEAEKYRQRYRDSIEKAQLECPPPEKPPGEKKRGRVKRSKSRNLLERLISHEEDVLRFMENPLVPFTNNQGENDIRMTKVQQKISGCFRSIEGAKMFCRIRGYLSTCRKQGISSSEAMNLVFEGNLPDFILS